MRPSSAKGNAGKCFRWSRSSRRKRAPQGCGTCSCRPRTAQLRSTTALRSTGQGLSNLQYAFCAEEMGRLLWSSEAFNCSRPSTATSKYFHRYGAPQAEGRWLKPLDEQHSFASLHADPRHSLIQHHQHQETHIEHDGDHYVINGTNRGDSAFSNSHSPRSRHHDRQINFDARTGRMSRSSSRSTRRREGSPACCPCSAMTTPAQPCRGQLENIQRAATNMLGEGRRFESPRRAVWARAASTTACAPSARPRKRSTRW